VGGGRLAIFKGGHPDYCSNRCFEARCEANATITAFDFLLFVGLAATVGFRPNMVSASPRTGWLRFTLCELLLLLAFVAIGCAALKYAGGMWLAGLSSVVLLLFMGAVVLAAVDRGNRQAQAIGFALCVAIYGVVFWSTSSLTSAEQNPDLDPQAGRLPTSKALAPVFEAIVKRSYHDVTTGQETAPPAPGFGGAYVREIPDRSQFMATGHLLFALAFGYLGSRVALWAYARRSRTSNEP
jgi:hypothetical protein